MSLEENSPVYSKGINVLKPDTIRRLDPAFVAVYNEVQRMSAARKKPR